jgi:hypothetical protein
MDKTIILLACSRKMSNYCVAGIDLITGEWIRIISEDASIQHAVRKSDMVYEDGTYPQLFDIVNIKCKQHAPSYYQPENWVLDNRYYWEKLGTASLDYVLKIHPIDSPDHIFYDNCWKIDTNYIARLDPRQRYSLTLISPSSLHICIGPSKNYPNKKSIKAQFRYKGQLYQYITVTDIEYENIYSQYRDGIYIVDKNVLLVLSLADLYEGYHYKLVATIIQFS